MNYWEAEEIRELVWDLFLPLGMDEPEEVLDKFEGFAEILEIKTSADNEFGYWIDVIDGKHG